MTGRESSERTFLLCVGAQKAGTTWLHRYLSSAPEFAPGAMKEYHVWDALYDVDEEGAPALEGASTQEREALRRKLIAAPELYFDHFEAILEQESKRICADITPAYSGLPAEALGRIADGFGKRGIAFRVIFFMRDPVERCWSAARMYRRKGLRVAGLDPSLDETDYVLAYAATPHAQRRGRYDRTIRAIEAAVPREAILFGFYETLFEPASIRALSAFLRVDAVPGFAARAFNSSPKTEALPEQVCRLVAETYRATLEFTAARFPQVHRLWDSYSLVR
jgi:hypothetical protein